MRDVSNINKVDEDEQFDHPSIIDAITGFMSVHRKHVTATVSEEWDRSGNDTEIVRAALNDRGRPQNFTPDLILSLEIRVPGRDRGYIEAIQGIDTRVQEILIHRANTRNSARVQELQRAKAAKLAEAAELDRELAALQR